MITGVDLVECKLTRAQKALLDWGRQHPHSRIKELEFVDGQPMKIVVATEDGVGTELVRFDKMIKGA
jgi:hypothetical protein